MARKNPYAKPDRFTRQAKAQGYPARSVFKLEEIDRRVGLLKPGMHVLDLGAAPGSWSLYVAQRIGPKGKLLAVDTEMVSTALPAQATFILGDAFALDDDKIGSFAPYDVVLSDMAPKTTGSRILDQTRSYELFMRALAVAAKLVRPKGAFVGKIFMGEDLPAARREVRKYFDEERLIRPEGTRSVSYEVFVVGIGRNERAP
jgi:23S rRNA (uridine2552-2'-O)-methyltransferase